MARLKFLPILLTLSSAAFVTACHDDDELGPQAVLTTSELVDQEISGNTAEGSAPLPINRLRISDEDTTDTGLPRSI